MKRERAKLTNDRRIQSDAELDELNRMLDEGKPEHAEHWTMNGRVGSKSPGLCLWCQRRVAAGEEYCCVLHEKLHAVARARRMPRVFLPYPSTAEQRTAFVAALREDAKKSGRTK